MTTKQINEHIEKLTTEINKVKTYNTKLANKLIETGIEIPAPNWKGNDEQKINN